jgi:hypothetical protein
MAKPVSAAICVREKPIRQVVDHQRNGLFIQHCQDRRGVPQAKEPIPPDMARKYELLPKMSGGPSRILHRNSRKVEIADICSDLADQPDPRLDLTVSHQAIERSREFPRDALDARRRLHQKSAVDGQTQIFGAHSPP